MEYSFDIKSSSSNEIYTVVFSISNLISINCNCKAGLVKMLCKHRLNLLDGDITSLVNPKDSEHLSEVLNKIDKSRIANLYTNLNKIEAEIKSLDTIRKKLRKEIGQNFSDGF